MEEKYFDPGETKSKNGYTLDEVVSALQKGIRRGTEEEAMFWALELVDSGYAKWLWKRLAVIASEDVGLADNSMAVLINSPWLSCKEFSRSMKAPLTEIVYHAVLALCRAPKNQEASNLGEYVRLRRKQGWRIDVPDYAVDQHTKRGRILGRGDREFYTEGARLEKEVVIEGNKYGKKVRELVLGEQGELFENGQ